MLFGVWARSCPRCNGMAQVQISFITPTSFVIQRAWRHQAQSPLTSHLPPHPHTQGSVAHMANTSPIAENVVDPASVSMGGEQIFVRNAKEAAYANTADKHMHAKTATTARAPLRTVRSLAIDLRGRGCCYITCARSTLVCQRP